VRVGLGLTVTLCVVVAMGMCGLVYADAPLAAKDKTTTEYRLMQLERKVAGMQKQITILHAKCRALEAHD
jgi:hypothetical protein